jgi:folate-binding protein YgfZ
VTAGLPEIPAELGPGDLPNEGGLEHEAISFTKGCYLGQEVMARLHNLGQVRRRLFVVEALAPAGELTRGTVLFAGEKRVGELRSLLADESPALGLAMVHTDHVTVGDELGSAPGGARAVRVRQLAEGRAW